MAVYSSFSIFIWLAIQLRHLDHRYTACEAAHSEYNRKPIKK